MPELFGKQYTRRELMCQVGDLSQIGGIRPLELVNGNERGVRGFSFQTGSGLDFTVLADRGLDIFDARFNGASLCWHSPAGPVAPAFYDSDDLGWLWSMPGGLLVTCGLTHAGPPEMGDDEPLGLHGRASNIPAKNVAFGCDWEGDDYVMWASGEIRQARLFGTNLVLRRNIVSRLGESRILIKDEIENLGFEPAPLMILYHCNIGFPVVDDGSELLAVVNDMEPRDAAAKRGRDRFEHFEGPQPGYEEQVFFIDHDTDERGMVQVALVNRAYGESQGLGVYMSYPKKELPEYTEWKMVGEGAYVVGMEPGNCRPEGRHQARSRGVLQTLEPGEKNTFHLELGVLPSNAAIRAFEMRLRGMDV